MSDRVCLPCGAHLSNSTHHHNCQPRLTVVYRETQGVITVVEYPPMERRMIEVRPSTIGVSHRLDQQPPLAVCRFEVFDARINEDHWTPVLAGVSVPTDDHRTQGLVMLASLDDDGRADFHDLFDYIPNVVVLYDEWDVPADIHLSELVQRWVREANV